MEQDGVVLVALMAHDSGTNLTEANTVSPALASQAETLLCLLDVEGRTIQMALTESTANLEFLANGEGFLCTHNLQFPDAATLASLQGNEVGDGAEVVLQLFADEIR